MSPFEELDAYLGEDMSLSYWSDEGIDVGAGLIGRFGAGEWSALKAAWRERPPRWQLRCADVLEYADPAQGIPLLLAMLVEGDDELAQQAAYTLNMRRLQAVDIEAGPPARERLERLASERPGDAQTSRALLGRIRFSG